MGSKQHKTDGLERWISCSEKIVNFWIMKNLIKGKVETKPDSITASIANHWRDKITNFISLL